MTSSSPPVAAALLPRPRTVLAQRLRTAAQLLVLAIALLCLFLGVRMDRDWADRHLLPDILVSSDWLMTIVQAERWTLLILGCLLLLAVLPRPGRSAAQRGDAALLALKIGAVILLALPASEAVQQLVTGRRGQAWVESDEPLRRADPTLGWRIIPSRHAIDPEFPSRPLYAIDRHGYRVPATGTTIDRAAPSVLFAGESIMFGKGLNWNRTAAGQLERLSGVQSANMAVTAYSAGQTHLRLKGELPRFRHPLAVVILFAPTLLVRDLDRNRPWFDSMGRQHPARRSWYLTHLAHVLFPYRSPAAIAEAAAADRRLLLADIAMIRARGARPIILVPVFQPEPPRERELRAAIFGTDMPHLIVPLDRSWRLLPDLHPDARANMVMARALWTRLKSDLQQADAPKNSLAFELSSFSEEPTIGQQRDRSSQPRRCQPERRQSGAR